MAYKDEYEVARLYTDPPFRAKVEAAFEGDYTLNFHLAPPLFAERDAHTGVPKKRAYGPWMMKAFGVLAKLKGLRGTRWDVFGYTAERRMERELIGQLEADLERITHTLDAASLNTAIALAKLPQEIRGFGHVKLAAVEKVAKKREQLLLALNLSDAASNT
jgi:indolepyruvate ferredoxin oxidoreductase